MPGFDGTGPRGFGPMMGGGRGYCVVEVSSQTTPFLYGRSMTMPRGDGVGSWGMGRRAGFCGGLGRNSSGRGWRHGSRAGVGGKAVPQTPNELTLLEEEMTQVESYVKDLRSRIENLKSQPAQ